MIVTCQRCGQQYERFNNGGYQIESPHKCRHQQKNSFINKIREEFNECKITIITGTIIMVGCIAAIVVLKLLLIK